MVLGIMIILTLLLFVSGIGLMLKRPPYNKIILTVHKLSLIGFIIYYSLENEIVMDNLWLVSVIVTAIIAVLSGGVLSVKNKRIRALVLIHKFTAIIYILALILLIFKI